MQLRSYENFMNTVNLFKSKLDTIVIMSLKEQKRREQAESRNMSPMNTFDSIEYQPIRRKKENLVGQSIYQRYLSDTNSSFDSKYPQI